MERAFPLVHRCERDVDVGVHGGVGVHGEALGSAPTAQDHSSLPSWPSEVWCTII